jgi:purine-cytosine permease-like protein
MLVKFTVFILLLCLNEKLMAEWGWLRKAEKAIFYNLAAFIVANLFAYSFGALCALLCAVVPETLMRSSEGCLERIGILFLLLLGVSAIVAV